METTLYYVTDAGRWGTISHVIVPRCPTNLDGTPAEVAEEVEATTVATTEEVDTEGHIEVAPIQANKHGSIKVNRRDIRIIRAQTTSSHNNNRHRMGTPKVQVNPHNNSKYRLGTPNVNFHNNNYRDR